MLRRVWKKYGRITAAAVFLTAAGLYYGIAGRTDDAVMLKDTMNSPGVETVQTAGGMEDGTAAQESPENPRGYFVHICGEVENPGVYELPEGSRIFEAVEAAGGFTEQAAESSMNLAGKITDGMQIVILSQDEMRIQESAAEEAAAGRININTASREQLMTLPGIGEARADDIIRYREESGGFQTIEDIKKVSGIKDAAYQKIKDSITV